MRKTVQRLIERRPELRGCADAIDRMIDLAGDTFARGGTLFTCGNGGSAADADHICGELLKGFLQLRPLASDMQKPSETGSAMRAGRRPANCRTDFVPFPC